MSIEAGQRAVEADDEQEKLASERERRDGRKSFFGGSYLHFFQPLNANAKILYQVEIRIKSCVFNTF